MASKHISKENQQIFLAVLACYSRMVDDLQHAKSPTKYLKVFKIERFFVAYLILWKQLGKRLSMKILHMKSTNVNR